MKLVKSLLLGSAAGLIAVGGAQAADLPLKAKAVEYVKICSLYGAGFYYIPGTDTCIKLGGYLRVETALNTNSVYGGQYNGVAGAQNRYSNYFTARSREDLNIDTRTATEYGVVRTFFDATFSWTSGSYSGGTAPAGTPYAGDGIAGGTLGMYYAFIQFAGFTMGKAVSQFDTPWQNYPGNNFDGLVGGGGTVTGVNQFSYTADFGQGISGTISLQDPTAYGTTNIWNTSYGTVSPTATTTPQVPTTTFFTQYFPTFATGQYGTQSLGGTRAPDVIGMLRVDQAWGLFQASVAAHDNHASYYNIANETSGHPGDKWGWAGQLALSIKNIPTGAGDTINIQGAYSNGASRYVFQSLVPTTFAMYGGSNGAFGAYQSLGFAGVSDAVFSGLSSATGTGLELTTAYGIRGAYTHNWDPYWNTAIYGAWAAMRYSGTAKSMICDNNFLGAGGFAASPVAGSGFSCNPDFNISQLGLITRWTPVKNLTFSADVTWSNLDQKYTGAVAIPTTSGSAIAKPTAIYQLKDQNTVSMLLRAQRNW